jgi:hypothetical protein
MTSKPWHLLNKNKYPRSIDEIATDRLSICYNCPSLIAGICKECGCIMNQKVKLELATCPIGKW